MGCDEAAVRVEEYCDRRKAITIRDHRARMGKRKLTFGCSEQFWEEADQWIASMFHARDVNDFVGLRMREVLGAGLRLSDFRSAVVNPVSRNVELFGIVVDDDGSIDFDGRIRTTLKDLTALLAPMGLTPSAGGLAVDQQEYLNPKD